MFMKNVLIILCVMCLQQVFSQLISGPIVDSKRKLLTKANYILIGNKEGVIVYDLTVDIYGNVTSETIVQAMTTIISSPLKIEARNYVKEFKFESGKFYPKMHHVRVKITFITS